MGLCLVALQSVHAESTLIFSILVGVAHSLILSLEVLKQRYKLVGIGTLMNGLGRGSFQLQSLLIVLELGLL